MVGKSKSFRGTLMVLLAMNFLVASIAWGQEQPAAAPDYVGLKQLQPDDVNVTVIGDLLPHIERVLTSPAVQAMVKEGRLGKMLATATGQEPDAARWLEAVEGQKQHIPTEIIMAMPDESSVVRCKCALRSVSPSG